MGYSPYPFLSGFVMSTPYLTGATFQAASNNYTISYSNNDSAITGLKWTYGTTNTYITPTANQTFDTGT